MEEVKISDVHLDLARKIAKIFDKGRKPPYISKEELVRVLHPALGIPITQTLLYQSDKLFRKIDTNKDSVIDVAELAAFFAEHKFKGDRLLIHQINSSYDAYL